MSICVYFDYVDLSAGGVVAFLQRKDAILRFVAIDFFDPLNGSILLIWAETIKGTNVIITSKTSTRLQVPSKKQSWYSLGCELGDNFPCTGDGLKSTKQPKGSISAVMATLGACLRRKGDLSPSMFDDMQKCFDAYGHHVGKNPA